MPKTAKPGQAWVCVICGYVYDPKVGDPQNGIPPGTDFWDLPDDWCCPACGATRADFARDEGP